MNDFESEQKVRTDFAKWWTEGRAAAFDYFSRKLAHSLGRPYFWDMPPADRKQIYGVYPPISVDGQAFDFRPEGGPNWAVIAQTRVGEYERFLDDYAELIRDEEKKIIKLVEEQQEEMGGLA